MIVHNNNYNYKIELNQSNYNLKSRPIILNLFKKFVYKMVHFFNVII